MSRTQAERRADTIGKLIDATITALHDVGYARTTTKEVCARAGVSQGGLFRHFSTRLQLIVAAADEVATRHATAFAEALGHVEGDPLEAAVRAARDRCRSPINAAWHELMVACRTDAELRDAMAPAGARHKASIEAMARAVVGDAVPAETAEAAVWLVVNCFDGEAISRPLFTHPQSEELRLRWIVQLLRAQISA